MSTHLDLDDCVAGNPEAEKELAELREINDNVPNDERELIKRQREIDKLRAENAEMREALKWYSDNESEHPDVADTVLAKYPVSGDSHHLSLP